MYFGLKYQLQNDTRLRLNGCLEVVKLSLASGMSYTDLVIIVLQSETEVMTSQAH